MPNFIPTVVGVPAGKIFGELYELVKDATEKVRAFEHELQKIKRTLESLEPLVKEIDRFNRELDRPTKEAGYFIRILEEGKKLVLECLEVNKYNLNKKRNCTDELRKFEESLKSYLQINVQTQQSRDIKEILLVIKLINQKLNGQTSGVVHSDTPKEVHPLPLPPAAATVLVPASVPQAIVKSESMPLKSQWQKGKLIGRGTFGRVYVARNRDSEALCAMKEVDIIPDDPKSAECIKQLEQEIKDLSQLKHRNIVQYYGSEIVEDRFYVYMEYVLPGSINRYISEHCGAMTENVVRSFTCYIVSGLAYLHTKKIVHRDIKGANLLVDASGVVKLAGFGIVKHLSGQSASLSFKGSPYWMAPEIVQSVMLKNNGSDLALADIWSLGCTVIEMFTGKRPWSEYEGAAAMFKVLMDTPPIPESLSPEGKDFLHCCLRRNPAERSTANVLLEHRWLKNLQQLYVPSSTPLITGMKLMDSPQSEKI